MHFLELRLKHFRNYTSLALACDPGLNVFVGPNAQGKSNLLESMYVLSTGRSFRTTRDAELIEWGVGEARVEATVARDTAGVRIEVQWREGGKRILVDGTPLARVSDLFGVVMSVAFTPDDLQLIKGPPAGRRRFLDDEIGQVSAVYRHHLDRYQRVLRQRNKVLQAFAEGAVNRDAVEAWDPQLVESGARVVAGRARAVQGLEQTARDVHLQVTGGREGLSLAYRPFFFEESRGADDKYWEEPLSTIEDRFRAGLSASRADERRRGRTLVGPQRDDLAFLVDGADLRAYGSQGQQRSAVLSVKLAEITFMHEQTGERPVLLLDDVLSELDEQRRDLIVQAAQGRVQTFITTAHLADLGSVVRDGAAIFHIREGKVVPQSSAE